MVTKKTEVSKDDILYQGYQKAKEKERFRIVEPGEELENENEYMDQEKSKDLKKEKLQNMAIIILGIVILFVLFLFINKDIRNILFGEKQYTGTKQSEIMASSQRKSDVRNDVIAVREENEVMTEVSAESPEQASGDFSNEQLREELKKEIIESIDLSQGKDGIPGMAGQEGAPGEDGRDGAPGVAGEDGKNGTPGIAGKDGEAGTDGKNGIDGQNGENGQNGKSAYELAVEGGFLGTEEEYKKFFADAPGKLTALDSDVTALNNNITEQGTKLTDLDTQLQSVFRSVSDGKALLASTLTDKGITTAQDATFLEIKKSIEDLDKGTPVLATYCGTVSNGTQVDLTKYYKGDWSKINSENFYFKNIRTNGILQLADGGDMGYDTSISAPLTANYDAYNHTLSISCNASKTLYYTTTEKGTLCATITSADVYLIY